MRAGPWLNGFIGMLIFSGSLPATRVAVMAMDPWFVTLARAAIAGLLGGACLLLARQPRPRRADAPALVIMAAGIVIAFPLLTGLALQRMTAAHGVMFLGLLPLSTASFAVLRARERPRPAFWAFALAGAAAVGLYAASLGGGTLAGDGLMLAAVAACGLGYAEGAQLSRRLGGWQATSWALVACLPFTLAGAIAFRPASWQVGWPAALALAYVSVFSMLVGFVFWYRGLAQGGIAAVGQLQLLQPFFGLALAALLLHEPVGPDLLGVCTATALCVLGARRHAAPLKPARPGHTVARPATTGPRA